MGSSFPPFIEALPEADLPIPGVWTRFLQSERGQVVFFRIPAGSAVPPHSHGAQWGLVVSGRVELVVDGVAREYGPGENYYIPAGAVHTARCLTDVEAVDFFADNDRYKPKTPVSAG